MVNQNVQAAFECQQAAELIDFVEAMHEARRPLRLTADQLAQVITGLRLLRRGLVRAS